MSSDPLIHLTARRVRVIVDIVLPAPALAHQMPPIGRIQVIEDGQAPISYHVAYVLAPPEPPQNRVIAAAIDLVS